MRNIIILGSGRSGTSMVTGLFRNAGYFMGDGLHCANDSNPKGYFEDEAINRLNEDILSTVLPRRPKGAVGNLLFRSRVGPGQMWLARVPIREGWACDDQVSRQIRELTGRDPFCFKDPRFSYTLPLWRPFLRNTRFLVVFRHPSETAKSVGKACREVHYLRNLSITREQILETWWLMYSHILEMPQDESSWLFLHYSQVFEPGGLDRLQTFTGAAIDRTFPEEALRRSVSSEPVPSKCILLYERLCKLANYSVSTDVGEDLSVVRPSDQIMA